MYLATVVRQLFYSENNKHSLLHIIAMLISVLAINEHNKNEVT